MVEPPSNKFRMMTGKTPVQHRPISSVINDQKRQKNDDKSLSPEELLGDNCTLYLGRAFADGTQL